MSVKLIASGNRLMSDDAVAIHVAEKLRQSIQKKGIEVLIGETDFEYCIGKVKEGDRILILDSTWFGIQPGAITVKTAEDIYKLVCYKNLFSQHGYSLINGLRDNYSHLDALFIGIEGSEFDFDVALSEDIINQFDNICSKVEKICEDFVDKQEQKNDLYER